MSRERPAAPSSRGPRTGRARGRFDVGRVLSLFALTALVLVGAAAVAAPFLFGSKAIRARIEAAVAKIVKEETGLSVQLRLERALWPPGVVVRDVRVESTTPGRPFASVREARVSLRPFSLLSGAVVIDQVELDGVRVDAEILDGAPHNLPLALKPRPPKKDTTATLDPPFRVITVTGAHVKLSVASTPEGKGVGEAEETLALDLSRIDFDVDVVGKGAFEYQARLHRASGLVRTRHREVALPPRADRFAPVKSKDKHVPDGHWIVDEDTLCALSLQVGLVDYPQSRSIKLQHLAADVRLDADEALGNGPACTGSIAPEQVVALRLDHLTAEVPKDGREPRIFSDPGGAKLLARGSAALGARFAPLPEMGGWAQLELELAANIDLHDPLAGLLKASATGRIETHDVQLEQLSFGSSLAGDVAIKPGVVIAAKRLDVRYGDAEVRIDDFDIRPLAPKVPLSANVHIKDLTFPSLMRQLGVSKASHVRWDIYDGAVKMVGTLAPLALDGVLNAKTRNMELGERPVEGLFPGHIIGLTRKGGNAEAAVQTRLSIRPTHFGFEAISASFGASRIVGRVSLGFDERLDVDVKSDQFDLADITPLSIFALGGTGKFALQVHGKPFGDPIGDGTVSFDNFVFDQFKLGNVESAKVHFKVPIVEISDLHARHAESRYDVPSMRIDLGHPGGVVLDALVKSSNFDLEDLYEILKLKVGVKPNGETFHDPRWDEISGHVGFDARAHFVVGGADDPCGVGRLDLDMTGKVLALDLYGERYDGGTADMSFVWWDRRGGGLGMDLDVHSAALHKKGGGSIVASGTMKRGGRLAFQGVASGLSLKSLSALPTLSYPIEGTVDGVASVGGTLDTMRIDADVHVSPVRVGDKTLEASHVHVVRDALPLLAPSPEPDSKGCYGKVKPAAFDLARFASDPVTGEYSISGNVFGTSIRLEDFRVTDQRLKVARGTVKVRELDLAPVTLLRKREAEDELADKAAPANPLALGGRVSADIILDHYPIATWWDAAGRVEHFTLEVREGDIGVATSGETPAITFGEKGVTLPEMALQLRFADATTKMLVAAAIDRTKLDPFTKSPTLSARIELPVLPLSRLEGLLPGRIDRAEGTAKATLSIGGSLAAPTWSGELAFDKAGVALKGFSVPLANLTGRVRFDPKYGMRVVCTKTGNPKEECTAGEGCECLRGEMGGGTVDLSGGAELKGFQPGALDLRLAARDVHFRYGTGMSATFDADLHATWSPGDPGTTAPPVRVEGVVDVDTALYEKNIKVFDVNSIQAAKRTEVEAYDPARDSVSFDVRITSKRGFRIKNNLADATVGIEKGGGLHVLGTNQRFGLVGDLFVTPGGIFRFRRQQFEIREGTIKFEHEDKIEPAIDVLAVTEYKRAAGGAGTTTGAEWRIKLHAYGTSNDLKLELTSEPALSQEDIVLLLTIGMTRAEATQLGTGNIAGGGLDLLAGITGVDETLKQAIPVIDDIKFGTAYSVKTGRTEPQVTLGKRITDTVRASVTSGFGERREVMGNFEWQVTQKWSLQGSYDNVNNVSSGSLGNVGFDLRFRFEFE